MNSSWKIYNEYKNNIDKYTITILPKTQTITNFPFKNSDLYKQIYNLGFTYKLL